MTQRRCGEGVEATL